MGLTVRVWGPRITTVGLMVTLHTTGVSVVAVVAELLLAFGVQCTAVRMVADGARVCGAQLIHVTARVSVAHVAVGRVAFYLGSACVVMVACPA